MWFPLILKGIPYPPQSPIREPVALGRAVKLRTAKMIPRFHRTIGYTGNIHSSISNNIEVLVATIPMPGPHLATIPMPGPHLVTTPTPGPRSVKKKRPTPVQRKLLMRSVQAHKASSNFNMPQAAMFLDATRTVDLSYFCVIMSAWALHRGRACRLPAAAGQLWLGPKQFTRC